MVTDGNASGPVRSVAKAIEIIELLTFEKENWGTREIAARLRLSPSSVSRLLRTLKSKGLVSQDPANQKYHPGLHLFRIAAALSSRDNLKNTALPVMNELVRETGETSYLCAYFAGQYVVLDKVECTHPIRFFLDVGSIHTLHAGAAGKAILAALDRDVAERIISERGLPRITKNTITDAERLAEELEAARGRGYTFSRGERVEGAIGIASPIMGRNGVVGCVVITMPESRFSEEDLPFLGEKVRAAGEKISNHLGYYGTGFPPGRSE